MARNGSQPVSGTCRHHQEPHDLKLARHPRATANGANHRDRGGSVVGGEHHMATPSQGAVLTVRDLTDNA